jgi:hypothetical protein
VYSKAAYLRTPGGLVALTSFDVPSGPVHARTSVPFDGLRVGDKVVVTESLLQVRRILLDLRNPSVWRAQLPSAERLTANRSFALQMLGTPERSDLDLLEVETVAELLEHGDLRGAVDYLGGAGPGLTPAGDDCLAGIMLIASLQADSDSMKLRELAFSVPTNDIARAFLYWAAQGQSIDPVHRFLLAVGESNWNAAEDALSDLIRYGSSSGAYLALGLRMGLKQIDLKGNRESSIQALISATAVEE